MPKPPLNPPVPEEELKAFVRAVIATDPNAVKKAEATRPKRKRKKVKEKV